MFFFGAGKITERYYLQNDSNNVLKHFTCFFNQGGVLK